jgi:hypothetical protein
MDGPLDGQSRYGMPIASIVFHGVSIDVTAIFAVVKYIPE